MTGDSTCDKGDPAAEIVLLSFSRPDGALLSATPFAGKLEMMLRLAGLPVKGCIGNILDGKHAPKKKFPVLRHDGNIIADSDAIAKYLRKTYPDRLDRFFPEDVSRAALALSLQRTLEESTYFAFNYCSFVPRDVFMTQQPIIFHDFGPPLRGIVAAVFRRKILRDLHGQGIGRHSYEYIKQRLEEELGMCSGLLATSGAYLTGSSPVLADCYLFALIDLGVYGFPSTEEVPFAFAEIVKKQRPLMAFYERLKAQCFPEGTETQFDVKLP